MTTRIGSLDDFLKTVQPTEAPREGWLIWDGARWRPVNNTRDHLMDAADRRRVALALIAVGLAVAIGFVLLWLAVLAFGELQAPAAANHAAGASLADLLRAFRDLPRREAAP